MHQESGDLAFSPCSVNELCNRGQVTCLSELHFLLHHKTSPRPSCCRSAWLLRHVVANLVKSFICVRGKINDPSGHLGVVCHLRSFLQPKPSSHLIFRKAGKCQPWHSGCRNPQSHILTDRSSSPLPPPPPARAWHLAGRPSVVLCALGAVTHSEGKGTTLTHLASVEGVRKIRRNLPRACVQSL